jgi:carboxylesterase
LSTNGFVFQNDSDTAILLLHGLTGSPFEMHQYGKMLSNEGYDVYCPILPGHCEDSEGLKGHTWQEWKNFTLAQFDDLASRYKHVYISGLCLGAVLGLAIAEERKNVSGIIGLSTTLFLDGWAMPWYMFLAPVCLYSIFKMFYLFPETDTRGIKCEHVRKKIAKMQEKSGGALDCYPMLCVAELLKISSFVRKRIKRVDAPIMLIHSLEDDLTSVKSAEFVFNNISSKNKTLIKLENSYHVITLDNEKKLVAEKTFNFIEKLNAQHIQVEHKKLAV